MAAAPQPTYPVVEITPEAEGGGGGGGPFAISDITGLQAALDALEGGGGGGDNHVVPVAAIADVDDEASFLGATGAMYGSFFTTPGSFLVTKSATGGVDAGKVTKWERNSATHPDAGSDGSDYWTEVETLSDLANLGMIVTAVVWGSENPGVGVITFDANAGVATLVQKPLTAREQAMLLSMIEDDGSAINDAIQAIIGNTDPTDAIHEATEYLAGGPVDVSAIIDCFGIMDPITDGSAPPALGVYDSESLPSENTLRPFVGTEVAPPDFCVIANPVTSTLAGFWVVGGEDPENPGTWLPWFRPDDSYVMYNGFTYGDLKALTQPFLMFEGSRFGGAGGALYQGKRTGTADHDWTFKYMTGGGNHVMVGNSQKAVIPPWVHEVRVSDGEDVMLLDTGSHCAVYNSGASPVSVRTAADVEIAAVAAGERKHFRNTNNYGSWLHDAEWGIDLTP